MKTLVIHHGVSVSNETTMKQVETINNEETTRNYSDNDLIDYKKLYLEEVHKQLDDKDREIKRLNDFIQTQIATNNDLIKEHNNTLESMNKLIEENNAKTRDLLIASKTINNNQLLLSDNQKTIEELQEQVNELNKHTSFWYKLTHKNKNK